MIRSGLLLGTGNLAAALLSLARNIIIARLISVEDFGIATTFAITMALVEMASNFSLDRLVVQARDGDAPHLLSTLHSAQAIRGLIGAGILFLAAGPIASLFGVPDLVWAYQALALVPLLRGLAHLDMFRRQRVMQFLPSVTVETAAQLLSSIAALPLALALGDHRAMLHALLIQQVVFTAASHLVAVRPYRWSWDLGIVRRAVQFGWPLLLNGCLMFGVFQGDRTIVGSLIGMTELGWFSVAFSLTFMPSMVLAKTLQSFFLPQLARLQDEPTGFQQLHLIAMQACLFAGVAMAVAFAFLGPALLNLLFGQKYEAAVSVLVWLAIMHGLRTARIGASVTATSRANTTTPLFANMARITTLPVAALSASLGYGVTSVVGIAIAGEAVALAVSLLLLRQKLSLALCHLKSSIMAGTAAFFLVGLDAYGSVVGIIPEFAGWSRLALIGAVLMVLWTMRELRRWSKSLLVNREMPGPAL